METNIFNSQMYKDVPSEAVCFTNETEYFLYLLKNGIKSNEISKPIIKYKKVPIDTVCIYNGEIFTEILHEIP